MIENKIYEKINLIYKGLNGLKLESLNIKDEVENWLNDNMVKPMIIDHLVNLPYEPSVIVGDPYPHSLKSNLDLDKYGYNHDLIPFLIFHNSTIERVTLDGKFKLILGYDINKPNIIAIEVKSLIQYTSMESLLKDERYLENELKSIISIIDQGVQKFNFIVINIGGIFKLKYLKN